MGEREALPVISKRRFFEKRVLPVYGFVLTSVFAVVLLINGSCLFIVPLLMMFIGYWMLRLFAWDLMDEVRDGGTFLIARLGDVEQRIEFVDVTDVSAPTTRPPRVTLMLNRSGPLGHIISFSPHNREVFKALIARVELARAHL